MSSSIKGGLVIVSSGHTISILHFGLVQNTPTGYWTVVILIRGVALISAMSQGVLCMYVDRNVISCGVLTFDIGKFNVKYIIIIVSSSSSSSHHYYISFQVVYA